MNSILAKENGSITKKQWVKPMLEELKTTSTEMNTTGPGNDGTTSSVS